MHNIMFSHRLLLCSFALRVRRKNGQKWLKFSNLTLKVTLDDGIESNTIGLAILKNPNIDTEITSLDRLEPILEIHVGK